MTSLFRLLSLLLCLGAPAAMPLAAQEPSQKETPPKEAPATEPATPESVPDVPEPPVPMHQVPINIPMEAFGTANPECVEWTDSCRTCARDAENKISCSTPGIACLPQDIACKKERGK